VEEGGFREAIQNDWSWTSEIKDGARGGNFCVSSTFWRVNLKSRGPKPSQHNDGGLHGGRAGRKLLLPVRSRKREHEAPREEGDEA